MKNAETLQITAAGEKEIVMTRTFDAPRALVWDAHTKPELIRRWLLGPDGWTMTVCDIDLRVGGLYRYVWHKEKTGVDMGMGGAYREIAAPERLVSTEKFDQSWYPGEGVGTLVLSERDGRTTLHHTMAYESREARDGVLKSGMADGVAASYDRLEKMLAGRR
jgi:uncharacterized protein YndB with AHSA1/START domain